jgi:purine-nucleoside phosphorylase
MSEYEEIQEAVAAVRERCGLRPAIGLILGSGLGGFCETLHRPEAIRFEEIPHFPRATIAGHVGRLVFGDVMGVPVAALAGRVHFYEGNSMARVGFSVRVLGCLGIRRLVVTNAAGGINAAFQPGDLMLIRDHINLMGANPLAGSNIDELGPRFPDMSEAYDSAMCEAALRAAAQTGVKLRVGVYVALSGPSYETPAEIGMCRILGGDAVGMSTVPEVIVANHMGIRVLGISCITNMAAGLLPRRLSHEEVLETTERTKEKFSLLLTSLIPLLSELGDGSRSV